MQRPVMAHEKFKDFVGGYGVAFVSLRGDVEFIKYIKKRNRPSIEKTGYCPSDYFY